MTFRLTTGYLQAKIDTANRLLGFDPDNDKWGTVGTLQLSSGTGGHAVHKIMNEAQGVSDLSRGYKTAREVACYLDGFIEALRQVQEGKVPAMMQPVTQEPDTEQLLCGGSGPREAVSTCVLDPGHDGKFHQDSRGGEWLV